MPLQLIALYRFYPCLIQQTSIVISEVAIIMSKKYIISIAEQDNYPFDGPKKAFQIVVVRVTHPLPQTPQLEQLTTKLQTLAQLDSPALIPLTRLKEVKGKYIEIDYQYVAEALAKSGRVCENGFLAAVREKLVQTTAYLAEHGIRSELRVQNLGVGECGEAKLFLGLNFQIVAQKQRKNLAQEYVCSIDRLLESSFGFRNSLRAHSDTQQSEVSQRVDRKLSEMEGKLNKLKLRSRHSSRDSSSDSCRKSEREPNIVLQAVSRENNNSSFTAGTSYSVIAHPQARPKVHKSSFGDYSTSSYRLNEQSMREDSLKKRVSHALQKTQQAFKIYEKYSRRKRRI